MAWSTPKEWAGSEVLTSADMNTYVGSQMTYLKDYKVMSDAAFSGSVAAAKTGVRMEYGNWWFNFTTASEGTQTITFNTAFTETPTVVTSMMNQFAGLYVTSAASVDTGSFIMSLAKLSGTATGTLRTCWTAVGV